MEVARLLLDQPHLSVITRHADPELARVQNIIEHKVLVDGRSDLEEMFGALLAFDQASTPKTLDLIGHSSPGKSLLVLGDWTIDAAKPAVTAYFRELAEQDVMRRLGIWAVRLIGCGTAETDAARRTISTIAEILGVEVYGTTHLIWSAHYNASGFADERSYCLVGSAALDARNAPPRAPGNPWPQVLDVDVLPTSASSAPSGAWMHRLASAEHMRAVLRLVRRRDGAQMPGLLAQPNCELVFPGTPKGDSASFRRMQIMLDGEFIRVYPQGPSEPGIVYPVDDGSMLKHVVDAIPLVDEARRAAS